MLLPSNGWRLLLIIPSCHRIFKWIKELHIWAQLMKWLLFYLSTLLHQLITYSSTELLVESQLSPRFHVKRWHNCDLYENTFVTRKYFSSLWRIFCVSHPVSESWTVGKKSLSRISKWMNFSLLLTDLFNHERLRHLNVQCVILWTTNICFRDHFDSILLWQESKTFYLYTNIYCHHKYFGSRNTSLYTSPGFWDGYRARFIYN
jgi:hypothetical protein